MAKHTPSTHDGLDTEIFGRSIDDIEDQLDLMQLSDFVYTRSSEVWLEYPRYLKALLMRLERLPNNLQRDEVAIKDVDPWMDKLFKLKNNPQIKELYFMVEEFRISLFSQPMKTKMPVSSTRLQKPREKQGPVRILTFLPRSFTWASVLLNWSISSDRNNQQRRTG